MKRAVTFALCLVTVAVGLWVINASQTMDSACTLSARLGNNSCVVGWPFTLVGVALIATGVISVRHRPADTSTRCAPRCRGARSVQYLDAASTRRGLAARRCVANLGHGATQQRNSSFAME